MVIRILAIVCIALVLTAVLPPGARAADEPKPAKKAEPWRGLHVLSFTTDKDLEALGGQVPQLAGMGLNVLVVEALGRYARFFGDELKVEYPTGSGNKLTLDEVSSDLRRRLISLFVPDASGRRPCFGWVERLQEDPAWKDNVLFNEYFHGDNGAGLGASHQTGWTGLAAELIFRERGAPTLTLGQLLAGSLVPEKA